MTTTPIRPFVSIAAAALSLACAHARPAASDAPTVAVRFDNEARAAVDVYLVGERREWRLARVAPGARATLHLPAAALDAGSGFVRLAVLADAAPTLAVARDPRAALTIAQPAASLVSQRWTYSMQDFSTPLLAGTRMSR